MQLVKTYKTKSDCPDATELLPLLQEAVKIYGLNNVRIYVAERTKNGYPMNYLEICCYSKEK